MRTFAVIAVILITTVLSRAEKLSFADLNENETIVIGYRSVGCRHSLARKYVVYGGDERRIEVYELETQGPGESGYKGPERLIAETRLTVREIRGLDSYLRYFHTDRSEGCTTTDHVAFGYFRDGKQIGEEQFEDGSCGLSGFYRSEGRVVIPDNFPADLPPETFWAIVPPLLIEQRIFEAKQNGEVEVGRN